MSYAVIQQLLDTHLQSLTGLPPLQLENTPNIGKATESFTRATLLPAAKVQRTVGLNGRDEIRGIYQADVFVPLNTGTATINALADDIVEWFPRGLMLASGGVVVHVQTASRLPGGRTQDGVFYSLPVQVRWSSIT